MSGRIYTKTGDDGTTSLIGGTRVSKADMRIDAYGTIDELNSFIGLCADLAASEKILNSLRNIQDRLFTIGSALACDPKKELKMKLPDLKETDISELEQDIDQMTGELPELKHFILPGGDMNISYLHVARCVCRRAERACVNLGNAGDEVALNIIRYLNRLSDYLFVLARYTGHLLGAEEIVWRPRV